MVQGGGRCKPVRNKNGQRVKDVTHEETSPGGGLASFNTARAGWVSERFRSVTETGT